MKKIKYRRQRLAILIEFMIMLSIMLVAIWITVNGMKKVYAISEENEIALETSLALQNLMEYCKTNKDDLEICLDHLGSEIREEEETSTKWTLYYDENWHTITSIEDASYSIEVNIKTTHYTYKDLKEIMLRAYKIQNYHAMGHEIGGIGKLFLLDLEGSCIVREEEL